MAYYKRCSRQILKSPNFVAWQEFNNFKKVFGTFISCA